MAKEKNISNKTAAVVILAVVVGLIFLIMGSIDTAPVPSTTPETILTNDVPTKIEDASEKTVTPAVSTTKITAPVTKETDPVAVNTTLQALEAASTEEAYDTSTVTESFNDTTSAEGLTEPYDL
ncbi:MAG: hypothetical protein KBD21_03295 [Candidatus Pacebacteria bacterium]|nr:hypothetical protein [Candidatus Paceibacterota bacterium]